MSKSCEGRLERAQEKDIARIQELDRVSGLRSWQRNTYADLLLRSDASCTVAVTPPPGERIVGFYIALTVTDQMDLLKIAVDPAFQGRGYGLQLLEHLLEEGRRMTIQSCFLEVRVSNLRAVEFYTRNGFRVMGLRQNYYTEPVEDALVMCRNL